MTTDTPRVPDAVRASPPAAAVPFAASIRLRLVVLVVAVGLPFVAYIGISALRQARAERDEARARLVSVARLIGARVDDYASDFESTLALASRGVTIDAASTAANDATLRGLRSDLPKSINNVGLWDLTGRNVGTFDRVRRGKNLDIGDRPYFRHALTEGTLAIDGPLASPTGDPIAVFARPVRGADGRIAGVVTASTRLSELAWLLDPKGTVPFHAVVSLVNADGKLLAQSGDGIDGHRVELLVARVATERAPWYVVVEAPMADALAASGVHPWTTVALGIASLALAALLAWIVGHRAAMPLRELARDAARLGAGDLGHRTAITDASEAGVLGGTLNRMADALQQHTANLVDRSGALERATHELQELLESRTRAEQALAESSARTTEALARAEASEERLRRITDNIPLMVGYIDRERRYRFNSRYYETWFGRPLAEITGHTVAEVLGPDVYARVGPNLERAFAGERVDYDVEVPGPDGARHVRGSYIPDRGPDGEVIGVFTSSGDVTRIRETERELERLAQFDALTGLANRHRFNDGIAAALQRSQRSGQPVALLFLDIDGFKTINDTLGHAAGDDVLLEFAHRLLQAVRSTDLVARLAGDEFVIVLEGVHGREEARFIARKIIASMRREFRAGDTMVRVTTSIGIALGTGGETTSEGLLKRADSALYAAKREGRDRFEIAI
ncbi:MAG TPA: diguanylate cyclase [Casimicrobiaceae bacterium]